MKKTIIAIAFSMSAFTAFSQDGGSAFDTSYSSGSGSSSSELSFTSKNGHEVLPKAGDWALGIGASQLFRYMGNMFNGNMNNNSPSFSPTSRGISSPSISIYGKKMIRDDFAYRASIDIDGHTQVARRQIADDNGSNSDDYLFDKQTASNYGIALSGGFENRRGRGRVQGIYGAEAYIYYSTGNVYNYEYANQITASNQTPTSFWTQHPGGINVNRPVLGHRVTKAVAANTIGGGIRGFIGVEYFFAPQMSIGGEFYLGAGYSRSGGESVTYEGFDGTTNEVRSYTNATESRESGFDIGTGNAGGSINLLFYF